MWKSESEPNNKLHCLINIYPVKTSSDGALVRPAILNPNGVLIDVDELISISKQIHEIDKQNMLGG